MTIKLQVFSFEHSGDNNLLDEIEDHLNIQKIYGFKLK